VTDSNVGVMWSYFTRLAVQPVEDKFNGDKTLPINFVCG